MIHGDLPVADAEGALLIHSLSAGNTRFKKGRKLSASDIAALQAEGVSHVFAARLEPGDVPEDEAAGTLAQALAGAGAVAAAPFTGRANIFAAADGVAVLDVARIERINLLHESLTVATLAPFSAVTARQMLATVKIIPLACPRAVLDNAVALANAAGPALRVQPFTAKKIGLIATRLPATKEALLDKTRRVLETRLAALGSAIADETRTPHDSEAIAGAIAKMRADGLDAVLVMGASATMDRHDVVPAAIEQAGGEIIHFGMPVDPGNLLLLARHGDTPVLGLPGCARSPKLNGMDWVLQRVMADLPVTPEDIMRMGVGGLLKEIPSRPQPRDSASATAAPPAAPRIAAIVLAAGQSRRMGAANKLLAPVDGQPMLTHVVDRALAARLAPVVVVTGHEEAAVRAALADRDIRFVSNPHYRDGLSTSLNAGIAALDPEIDGAIVMLGDMPDVGDADLARLVAAFDPEEGRAICVPTVGGKRGNPVLWAAEFFAAMTTLEGDVGAKHLIGEHADAVCEVPMPDDGALRDIDTPQALAERARKPFPV